MRVKVALLCIVLSGWLMMAQDAPRTHAKSNRRATVTTAAKSAPTAKRNVIIFVADGMRHDSVNAKDTPALYRVRSEGVHFANSYSLFPTFTTANASAIATGHRFGDTGDFSNTLYIGYPIFNTHNFNRPAGTITPFIENDEILADLNDHFNGNFLNEVTLLEVARENGFNTAAIGKIGPSAIQAIASLRPREGKFQLPETIIIDDSTNYAVSGTELKPLSVPVPAEVVARMQKAGLALDAPSRNNGFAETSEYSNGFEGDAFRAGTLRANIVQQQWMNEVATRVLLPMFTEGDKPFVMLFWSRDPDASQHNNGDSFQSLTPGINGPTSRAAIQNADRSLASLLSWLDAHPKIKANTDILITSDHGFATISRRDIDRANTPTKAESAKHTYVDAKGNVDNRPGMLPPGFLGIDLALALKTKLWNAESPLPEGSPTAFKQLRIGSDDNGSPLEKWEHGAHGSALLGGQLLKADGSDAMAIVAANGGSDLIYVPDKNRETVGRIVDALLTFDYVANIFVDDQYGRLAGTLPMSAIDLVGAAVMPRPAIVVGFKTFYLQPGNLLQGIQLSDGNLQQGQGNHGGFGRECTFNNMAAIGPDFKRGSIDRAPVGNADIVPTIAKILGLTMKANGKLTGRVMQEALAGGKDAVVPAMKPIVSEPAASGAKTVLFVEEFGGQKYFHSACMVTTEKIEPGVCQQK